MTNRRYIPKGGRTGSSGAMDDSDENQQQENIVVSFGDIGNFGRNTRMYTDDGGRSIDSSLDDEDISLDNFSMFDDLIGIADDGLDDTIDEGYNNNINKNYNNSNQKDNNYDDKNSPRAPSIRTNGTNGSVGTADVDFSISTDSDTDRSDGDSSFDSDDDDSSSEPSGSSADSDCRQLVTVSAIPGTVEYSKRKKKKVLRKLKRAKRKSKYVLDVDLLPIAAIETKYVRVWRIIVIVSILLLGAMFTTWVHLLLNNDKDSNNVYQSSAIISNQIFLEDAKAIETICVDRWKNVQDSIESIASTISYVAIHPNLSSSSSSTSLSTNSSNEIATRSVIAASFLKSIFFHHADATEANMALDNSTTAPNFPNIRIPHYEIFANSVRKSANNIIDSLSFVPLVRATTTTATSNTNDDSETTIISEWNTFSQEQYPLWIDDTIRSIAATTPMSLQNWSQKALELGHPSIWNYDDSKDNLNTNITGSHSTSHRKFYGPIWHVSPLLETTSSDIINFDLFSLPHVELLMNAILQQQQQQPQQGSGIASSKQQKSMMSAATTNLGPLYCMSTDTECTEQLRSVSSNSDGSTATNKDNSINNEWSADSVYESIFGASIRNSPRSLHLQPIYDNFVPVDTEVDSEEGLEQVVDSEEGLEQVVDSDSNSNESNIGAEQQGAKRTGDTAALGAGSRNRRRRQQSIVDLPIGVVASVIVWDKYLDEIKNVVIRRTMYGVLKNTCGQGFVYNIEKGRVDFLGPASILQDSTLLFDTRNEYVIPLGKQSNVSGQCSYAFHLYNGKVGLAPITLTIDYSRKTSIPMDYWALWLGFVFMVIFFSFCAYDKYVTLRTGKVLTVALRGERILSTLFPKQVRERMFAEDEKVAAAGTAMQSDLEPPEQLYHAPKAYLKSILDSGTLLDKKREQNGQSSYGDGEFTCDEIQDILYKSKPIADLFPETTILFADIAGFTAWSSVREPCQVFILLETVYRAFDLIAKRRRVFKVETVGDCYVAAAGLPDPIPDHAVAMARFARDCMETMSRLVKTLERSLGPDTADLTLRIGIHSGPVTAGVLRGDRSRFQLFGDTMNTAARMEQSGKKNRIQLSEETHRLLCADGKAKWMVCRQDKVSPKGKGEMITYWLLPKRIVKRHKTRSTTSSDMASSFAGSASSTRDSSLLDASTGDTTYYGGLTEAKVVRLVDWNVKVFEELLKRIAVRRKACPATDLIPPNEQCDRYYTSSTIGEVREIINLPKFDKRTLHLQGDPDKIVLPCKVVSQLHLFVQNIAAMYHDNPFHNFEHASHVLMSVSKLLNRIIAPDIIAEPERLTTAVALSQPDRISRKSIVGGVNAAALHDHTYGITSDPLTHFACVFSALIHDCDHPGVPNAQLVKEETVVAQHYENQSVAEQNSISLAWALLMQDEFMELRGAIYQTDAELNRFRELVVNSVLATDIVDKDLKALRNDRWDTAFDIDDCCRFESTVDATNRKATIVIEHLIQASDISHTMQHWHVYRKWNELFFMECYDAYANGRAEKDPSEFWYMGEIGFFDFYVIPLAKKLKECGVFGVSSDEYLNYATKNRQEWEERGIEIVNELVEKVKRGHARRHCSDSESCLTVDKD